VHTDKGGPRLQPLVSCNKGKQTVRPSSWSKRSVRFGFKRRFVAIIYCRGLKGTATGVISGGRAQFHTPLCLLRGVGGCSTPASSILIYIQWFLQKGHEAVDCYVVLLPSGRVSKYIWLRRRFYGGEHDDNKYLWNVGKLLSDYVPQRPGRVVYSTPLEPETSPDVSPIERSRYWYQRQKQEQCRFYFIFLFFVRIELLSFAPASCFTSFPTK
jgi:hypothetical protein